MTTPRVTRATTLLLCLLNGCSSWHPVEVSPQEFFRTQHPPEVRIDRHDGSRVTLRTPTLVGDSVRGDIRPPERGITTERAVGLDQVAGLETKRFSGVRTMGLLAGGVALAGLFIIAVVSSATDADY